MREMFACAECRDIARALRTAWRDDHRALRTRFEAVAASSGRDARQFGIGWVFSVASMPDDEMKALIDSHHPRFADAARRRDDHEAATGHSLKAWWVLLQYAPDDSD